MVIRTFWSGRGAGLVLWSQAACMKNRKQRKWPAQTSTPSKRNWKEFAKCFSFTLKGPAFILSSDGAQLICWRTEGAGLDH